MSQTAATEHRNSFEPLLELASPSLYRRNLFRVLGLSVTAGPRDVQRRESRRKMQEKLGITSTNGTGGPFALKPTPGDDEIRAAMERLNRPVDRLLDEIFWFWPTNGDAAGDAALKALEQGNIKNAVDLWTKQTEVDGRREIALHNLAVLDHLEALDYEDRHGSKGLGWRDRKRLARLWPRALARWKQVLDGEEFWSVVEKRVRDLNDVQLTPGLVRRIRNTLPVALLLISAKIAYGAAERSDAKLSKRHINLIGEAEFGDGLAGEAVRVSLQPLRNQLKTAVDTARSRWTNAPQKGNLHVRELHRQAEKLLAAVDNILPAEDLTRIGLHDIVAEAMFDGQIAFGNATNDWGESRALLKLAKTLAASDTVQSRLSENIQILKKNQKQGNDWCAPGYWELPEEVVAQLEAARERARAGDFEGAIKILMVMDPKIGTPLLRCISFTFSERGWQIALDGIGEFNSHPTSKVKRFTEELDRRGTLPLPHPHMSSYEFPNCPCCGNRSYTTWLHGEFNGQKFWMCELCAPYHEEEHEEKRAVLRVSVGQGLEYVLLSAEVDKRDPGIRESVKNLKNIGRDLSMSFPRTKALKKHLSAHCLRGVPHTFESTHEHTTCHFCGEKVQDDSFGITVPMCGDRRSIKLLFHKGIEYRFGDLTIPRCRRCRDEHSELPGRVNAWSDSRAAAAADDNFPEIAHTVETTEKAFQEATAIAERQQHALAEAQTEMEQAQSMGDTCEQCQSSEYWRKVLCRRCDSKLFKLGGMAKGGIAAAVVWGFVGTVLLNHHYALLSRASDIVAAHTRWTVDETVFSVVPVSIGISLFIGFALTFGLKWRQWRKRRQVREQRKAEIQERRDSAIPAAQEKLERAESAVELAEQALKKQKKDYEAAREELQAAKDRAISDFETIYPKPDLADGVKPESDYLTFGSLEDLREHGWGFGYELMEDGNKVCDEPIDVKGLVGYTPDRVTN